jgi:hypothetical protein
MMTRDEAQHLLGMMVQDLQWYLGRGSMGAWVLNVVPQDDDENRWPYIEIVDMLTGTVAMRVRSEEEYEALHHHNR